MTIYYEGDFRSGLPKWPAIVVIGEPVEPDQAAEIIIRTDHHIPEVWGNDKRMVQRINDLFGIPPELKYPARDASESVKRDRMRLTQKRWASIDRLRQELGHVPVEYLAHDRIISSYIGGTNGWCNWDGTIGIRDKNIGKWPEIEHVAKEWQAIIDAFPYLRLRCQLFDNEHCSEIVHPVVHYIVEDGDVIVRPSNGAILAEPVGLAMDKVVETVAYGSIGRSYDLGINELKAKLELVYDGNIPQYREISEDE